MCVDLRCTRTRIVGARLGSALGLALLLVALAAPPVAAQTTCMTNAQCDDLNPCTVDECFNPPMGPRFCTHTAGNMGAVCRASAGVCDVAETCTGSSPVCPPDTFQPITVTCRASAGECDQAETCTGTGPSCPSDAKTASGTACTSDGNPCTLDQCDGSSGTCQHPAGNAGAVCRASADSCDSPELCTGSSPTCPPDTFFATGTPCRTSTGECDPA